MLLIAGPRKASALGQNLRHVTLRSMHCLIIHLQRETLCTFRQPISIMACDSSSHVFELTMCTKVAECKIFSLLRPTPEAPMNMRKAHTNPVQGFIDTWKMF